MIPRLPCLDASSMKLPTWLKKLLSISRTSFLPRVKSKSPESIPAPTENKESHPPSATFNDLPQELLDRIIDYVADIPLLYRALEACALTCHALYPRTVTLRFRHINLATEAAFHAFESIVMGSLPHVIPHVESLSLRMPFREGKYQFFVPLLNEESDGIYQCR